MKMKFPLHICMCLLAVNTYADTVKLSALVLDSLSAEPIQDASVTFSFKEDVGIKIWTESAKHHRKSAKTDRQGRCFMIGKSNCGRAGCYVENPPEGYYAPTIGWKHKFQGKNLFGIWQPDNLVATIRLQRVEHPIPLFVRKVAWKDVDKGLLGLQGTNAVLRLDMMKGEWLPPYGHGETADLEISSELQITGKDRKYSVAARAEEDVFFYDLVQTIRPMGADDCISELQSDPTSGIKIRHGRDEGRGARIVRRQGRHKRFSMGGEWYSKRFDDTDDNRCYTFRIRSKYDNKGNLVEAYYGKVYGDFKFEGDLERGVISVRFLYYLNPTPLDRNLEWDMKTNLCPDSGNIGERRP